MSLSLPICYGSITKSAHNKHASKLQEPHLVWMPVFSASWCIWNLQSAVCFLPCFPFMSLVLTKTSDSIGKGLKDVGVSNGLHLLSNSSIIYIRIFKYYLILRYFFISNTREIMNHFANWSVIFKKCIFSCSQKIDLKIYADMH